MMRKSNPPPLTTRQWVITTLIIMAIKVLLMPPILLYLPYGSQAAPSPTEPDPGPTTQGSTADSPRCRPGWEQHEARCYLFSRTSENWGAARNVCVAQNADLVVINNAREQNYLTNKTASIRHWIGFTDQGTEGIWRWVDNTSATFTYWNKGEPNNLLMAGNVSEDCAHLLEAGRWNDEPCSFPYRWICERATTV